MAATRAALASPHRSSAALRVVRPAPAESDAPNRPDLRVVPPRRATGSVVIAAVVLVFGVLLATAALNTMLVSGQRDLDRIEAEIREADQRNQALAVEVAQLESPERIVEAAEAQGMVVPTDPTWLTIRPDGAADATATSEEGAGDVRADGDQGGGDATGDPGDERADGGPGGSGG
jgi:cell division protein FtsL